MLKKQKDFTLLLVIMLALTFGLMTGGCDPDDGGGDDDDTSTTTTTFGGGGNDLTKCIPCDGDFVLTCHSSDPGCPVCSTMDIDMGTGTINMKTCYEDGSCMEMVDNKMTFTDKFGKECFSMEIDETTITYEIGNKTYVVNEDGSWTCPNGTTWVMPEECEPEDTGVPEDSGSGTPGDDPDCPYDPNLPECG
jgi:hypothetical protein